MKGKEGGGTRGGVEDKESSECALDPDTSRAPKFSRAIRRGIAYEPPSLHLRRPILSRHISRNPSKFRGGGKFSSSAETDLHFTRESFVSRTGSPFEK